MSEVKVNNGNIEDALKRFKRQCARNQVLQEVKLLKHFGDGGKMFQNETKRPRPQMFQIKKKGLN